MEINFSCTQCGKCCRDTKVPLTVSEAIEWLNRGDEVQLLCEASPWPEALDREPRAAHFKRRSFPVMSGSMPTRVVVMLVANIVGACPNLLPNMRCGIYEDRPLVCRIYPAEINPFVALKAENKACPPEAWANVQPVLQREEVLMDEGIRHDIEMSRPGAHRLGSRSDPGLFANGVDPFVCPGLRDFDRLPSRTGESMALRIRSTRNPGNPGKERRSPTSFRRRRGSLISIYRVQTRGDIPCNLTGIWLRYMSESRRRSCAAVGPKRQLQLIRLLRHNARMRLRHMRYSLLPGFGMTLLCAGTVYAGLRGD
jgi:Fe-S-cluster containining protein